MTTATIDATFIRGTGTVERLAYGDGSLALVFMNGGAGERLSVNLMGYGIEAPEGCVWVPDYSVSEGLPEALERAGVAEPVEGVSRITFGGHDAGAILMKVLVP